MSEIKMRRGGNRRVTVDPNDAAYPLVNDLKGIRIPLSASARGQGLCVYLPKEICDLYRILAGDVVIFTMGKHYRKKREDDEESPEP